MHSFVPIASTQHMVGGVGLLLAMYLQCTAGIVNGLYVKFKCYIKILLQFFFPGKIILDLFQTNVLLESLRLK